MTYQTAYSTAVLHESCGKEREMEMEMERNKEREGKNIKNSETFYLQPGW